MSARLRRSTRRGPHLIIDGDRLVVVWSIYRGTTAEEMRSAVPHGMEHPPRAESLDGAADALLREGGDAGGGLIDLASDPGGGAVVVYGLSTAATTTYMQRLEPGTAPGPPRF